MHSVERWLPKTQRLIIIIFFLTNGPHKNSPQEFVTKIKRLTIDQFD